MLLPEQRYEMTKGSSKVRQYRQMKQQRWEESEKRKKERKKIRQEKESEIVRRKQVRMREKVEKYRKVVKHIETLCFFPMSCGSGGSKSRLPTAAGAEPSVEISEMRDQMNRYKDSKIDRLRRWTSRQRETSRQIGKDNHH